VGFERGIGCVALDWILSIQSEEDSSTTRLRRSEHMMPSKPRLQAASELERSKDQSSLANRLLLMPHPIIHSQPSNPELLHTVNSKQPGGAKLCLVS
jgi:hypothetical protein